MNTRYFLSVLSILVLLLAGCANQLPPTGGDIDKVPPEIITHFPQNGTINFDENYLEFEFSEYVDKRSVKDAFFISPAPEEEPEFEWSGRFVRIVFPRPLKRDITYSVSLGTDIVDLNNKNKMANAFNLTFATGNKIDKGSISGMVYGEHSAGVSLFAYRNAADTLNPAYNKPDYLTQSGTDGSFILSGLAPGKYTVFAVKDEYKDLLFQPEQDMLGVPSELPLLTEKDTAAAGINYAVTRIDTVRPRLLTAVMTDRDHILLTFSNPVLSAGVAKENVKLLANDAPAGISMLSVFKGRAKEKELVLIPADTISTYSSWKLVLTKYADANGNITTGDTVSLVTNDLPDTNKPQLFLTVPAQKDDSVDLAIKEFKLQFDDYTGTADPASFIYFGDTAGVRIKARKIRNDGASISVYPDSLLPSLTPLRLGINFRSVIDKSGNYADTTIYYNYTTLNDLEYTGLTGKVPGYLLNEKALLILQNVMKKDIRYFTHPDSAGNFMYDKIIPGRYTLELLYDTNGDKEFTQGTAVPLKLSEKFVFHKEAFTLPARWIVTDLFFTPFEHETKSTTNEKK